MTESDNVERLRQAIFSALKEVKEKFDFLLIEISAAKTTEKLRKYARLLQSLHKGFGKYATKSEIIASQTQTQFLFPPCAGSSDEEAFFSLREALNNVAREVSLKIYNLACEAAEATTQAKLIELATICTHVAKVEELLDYQVRPGILEAFRPTLRALATADRRLTSVLPAEPIPLETSKSALEDRQALIAAESSVSFRAREAKQQAMTAQTAALEAQRAQLLKEQQDSRLQELLEAQRLAQQERDLRRENVKLKTLRASQRVAKADVVKLEDLDTLTAQMDAGMNAAVSEAVSAELSSLQASSAELFKKAEMRREQEDQERESRQQAAKLRSKCQPMLGLFASLESQATQALDQLYATLRYSIEEALHNLYGLESSLYGCSELEEGMPFQQTIAQYHASLKSYTPPFFGDLVLLQRPPLLPSFDTATNPEFFAATGQASGLVLECETKLESMRREAIAARPLFLLEFLQRLQELLTIKLPPITHPYLPPLPKAKVASTSTELSHRDRVMKEIVLTERTYVMCLNIAIRCYLSPLQRALKKEPIINQEKISLIFGDLEKIVAFNNSFLVGLEKRWKSWSPESSTVGDYLKDMAPGLLCYANYLCHYEESIAQLTKARLKVASFAHFLDETQSSPECQGLSLSAYLIMPVQRIPRYKLLTEELLKYTDPLHPDTGPLTAALATIAEVATQINSMLPAVGAKKKPAGKKNS